MELEDYRVCSNCQAVMQRGYCLYDGEEYFCSEACLHSWYDPEQYKKIHRRDQGYWTTW